MTSGQLRIPGRWVQSSDLVGQFSRKGAIPPDRLAILASIWGKECGAFAQHWSLVAVMKGTVYVRPRSAAAAQELQLRAGQLKRDLNKYFSKPWIQFVRTTYR